MQAAHQPTSTRTLLHNLPPISAGHGKRISEDPGVQVWGGDTDKAAGEVHCFGAAWLSPPPHGRYTASVQGYQQVLTAPAPHAGESRACTLPSRGFAG